MKCPLLIFLYLLLNSCQPKQAVTYAQGLENCDKIEEEKKKNNPNEFFFVSADCITGAQVPEFEARSIDGRKINSELLKGKVTILNFWFIACPPCVAEIPGFNAIVEKFGTDQINYIAIGRDNKKDNR